MEFKIGDKKFVVKDKITGRDYIDLMDAEQKQAMDLQIKLMAKVTINPQLTADQILDMEFSEFMKFIEKFQPLFNQKIDFLEEK